MIILGPKTAILGPQFCRILVASFLVVGGAGPLEPPPGSASAKIPENTMGFFANKYQYECKCFHNVMTDISRSTHTPKEIN